jgi:2OG-Fe(II) oxygenase superfamily
MTQAAGKLRRIDRACAPLFQLRIFMSEFFNSANLVFRYEPYPIGHLAPMVDQTLYTEMLHNWPALDLFEYLPRLGNKYALSDNFHTRQYRAFVRNTPIWSRFDRWIKGPEFVREIMQALLDHHIDLGYRPDISWTRQTMKNILGAVRGRSSHRGARYTATWEFQMMPGDGGHILPHTDTPSKVVTMTLAMLGENEWRPEWGGHLDVNRPKTVRHAYNQLNRQAGFEDMEVVESIRFAPNTGVVFIKTFNSWHSVRPMQAEQPGVMRRNLIINIKTD